MNKVKFNIFSDEKTKNGYNLNVNPKLNATMHLVRNNVNNLNASNADADIMFLTDSIKGNKLNDYKFTDLLTEEYLMAKVPDAFNPVLNNPDILSENLKNINFNLNNGERIKNIFSEVITKENVEKYDSLFYETDIKGNEYKVTERDCFRAFMIYAINTKELDKQNKNILIVFLLDPYHLVCPLPFNGKDRDEIAENIFKSKKDCHNTFEENFKNKFDNIKFVEKESL